MDKDGRKEMEMEWKDGMEWNGMEWNDHGIVWINCEAHLFV